MILIKWDLLPDDIANDDVKPFYEILSKKKFSLFVKRVFDIILSCFLIIMFAPILIGVSLIIKLSSNGPIFFIQTRVTTCGRKFKIVKFRTMVEDAETIGSQITLDHDTRITKVGKFLRKYRIDEFPQIFNVFAGDMSFVGTRPEVPKYVREYTDEMKASLLLPAGVTSLASIKFKDEDKMISKSVDVDDTYINEILPIKMRYNLEYLKCFGFFYDISIIFRTFFSVFSLSKRREKWE